MLSLRRRTILITALILLANAQSNWHACLSSETVNLIPEDSLKEVPLTSEQSVSTFLPSSSAPGRGLAINIIYPKQPRYKDGAPIAVVVPGADKPNGLNFCLHAAQQGFVEVRFAFPGGGNGVFKSDGFNDHRGIMSQRALRDVILFAAGKAQDFRQRSIANIVPTKMAANNLGLVGWSNGGNIALITMEKYAKQLDFICWLALYECPLGSLFFPPSLGSTNDLLLNRHYRQGSAATGHCLIDFRKLAWQEDAVKDPGIHRKLGEAELPGVVYFDDNQNKKWDESKEFAFNYCVESGVRKQIYPPDITSAMERMKIFEGGIKVEDTNQNQSTKNTTTTATTATTAKQPGPSTISKVISNLTAFKNKSVSNITALKNKSIAKIGIKPAASTATAAKPAKSIADESPQPARPWPKIVATLEQSENYFQERDGSASIPAICSLYPNLLVTIFASQVDHLQTQGDHPHIVLQYNAFLDNNAHWVRLNPESIYPADMANMNKRNFVQNEPNTPIEASNIADYLEPEGILKDFLFVDATIAELADRKRSKNLASPLTAPIYHYSNGLSVPAAGQTNSPASSHDQSKQQNQSSKDNSR